MNIITKEELQYIETLKKQFIKNYDDFKKDIDESNQATDEYLKAHNNKKHKVNRTWYLTDRIKAIFNVKDKQKTHVTIKDTREQYNHKINERREESKGEYLDSNISTWVSGQYSLLHLNETHVDELDPKNKTLTDDDFLVNHSSMLKKMALYSAAKEVNSKRSWFSKLFNWKKDIQNYFATRKIRKSVQEENGLDKKEFKNVYKVLKKPGEDKFKGIEALNNQGIPIIVDDKDLEVKTEENTVENVYNLKLDKVNKKDQLLNKVEKEEREKDELDIESDEPSLF